MGSIAAVSSTTATGGSVGGSAGTGALEAQKKQCERQLSDWVNCASAKTPAGKAKIAEFTARLATINAQIQQAGKAREQAGSAATRPDTAGNASSATTRTVPGAHLFSPLGSRLDTYA
jgi:hypothetical protein